MSPLPSPCKAQESPVPAIRVENLAKRFKAVTAVDGVSFDLGRGETLALLGGNGAGKTTTISMLLGLIVPSAGRIEVLGHDMAAARHLALARVNFQSPYVDLPRRLTVRQNLAVYARLYGVRDPEGRIAELARDLDLIAFLDRPSGQLSAGQKTRVGLAKALINTPEVLLLDEPTASLDPDTADWVRSYLERYRETAGAAILLASHNMHEVERLADRVLMMKGGRVVDRGTPAELIARYGRKTMEEVFLAIARGEPMPPLPAEPSAGDGPTGRKAAV
ncbi:MAG: ABC transporter ATP-binding protein [Alphaproteobacteria bacterium]|nr:ABC transporter ATP-binding protein [Alphaproteobacteria bacterium]MDX5368453.1 ABC transporter ATP-binding protein [Alphaproteobacteria bacterium]MDX5463248.1 ABC transporter ATP-binding protein [Alphaproteobacteria bacterium]